MSGQKSALREVILELRAEGEERASHVKMGVRGTPPARGNSQCRCPEVRVRTRCLRNRQEGVAGVC